MNQQTAPFRRRQHLPFQFQVFRRRAESILFVRNRMVQDGATFFIIVFCLLRWHFQRMRIQSTISTKVIITDSIKACKKDNVLAGVNSNVLHTWQNQTLTTSPIMINMLQQDISTANHVFYPNYISNSTDMKYDLFSSAGSNLNHTDHKQQSKSSTGKGCSHTAKRSVE